MTTHEQTFTTIYENHTWSSTDVSKDFHGNSGPGSSLEFNAPYIEFLRDFIDSHGIKTVEDLGCGDWRTGPSIYAGLDVRYKGFDVYEPMIQSLAKRFWRVSQWNFEKKDCMQSLDSLGPADLLIVKDVLQHWTDSDIYTFMKFLHEKRRYKYVLITNCYKLNVPSLGPLTSVINFFAQDEGYFRLLDANSHVLKEWPLQHMLTYKTKKVYLWDLSSGMV